MVDNDVADILTAFSGDLSGRFEGVCRGRDEVEVDVIEVVHMMDEMWSSSFVQLECRGDRSISSRIPRNHVTQVNDITVMSGQSFIATSEIRERPRLKRRVELVLKRKAALDFDVR